MSLSRARGLIVALLGAAWLTATGASASSADDLYAQGQAHERDRDEDVAIRRYTDAITLDPSHAPSYLALGALRARRGDYAESERIYGLALVHLPGDARVLRERGRARWFSGRRDEAERDLEASVLRDPDVPTLRELASFYGQHDRPLAQLSVWRRLLLLARERNDEALAADAALYVNVLVAFTRPVDPAAHPADDSATRRGLARLAGRIGAPGGGGVLNTGW